MKVWLAYDEVLNYTIWQKEPFLVQNIWGKKFFENDDLRGRIAFRNISETERAIDKFPNLALHEVREWDIDRPTYEYYFLSF